MCLVLLLKGWAKVKGEQRKMLHKARHPSSRAKGVALARARAKKPCGSPLGRRQRLRWCKQHTSKFVNKFQAAVARCNSQVRVA